MNAFREGQGRGYERAEVYVITALKTSLNQAENNAWDLFRAGQVPFSKPKFSFCQPGALLGANISSPMAVE